MTRSVLMAFLAAAAVLALWAQNQGYPQINPQQIGQMPILITAPYGYTAAQAQAYYGCMGGGSMGMVVLGTEMRVLADGTNGDSLWVCLDGPAGNQQPEWVLEAQAQ